jgi:hypothetical protein
MTMGPLAKPDGLRPELYGVRGWLLFLCIVLMVFVPIGVLIELWSVWRRPSLTSAAQSASMLTTVVDVAVAGLAIAAGSSLYRMRPIGVRLAQIFFIVRLIVAIAAATEIRTAESALAIVVSAAWLFYLFRSERVRLTYSPAAKVSEVFR